MYAGADPSNYDEGAKHTLASYNSSSQSWSRVTISGGDFQNRSGGFGATTSDPLSGLSFFIGGDGDLLKVNLSNVNNPSWIDDTSQIGPGSDVTLDIDGAGLTYLAIGKAGILLLIGGASVIIWSVLVRNIG